MKKRAINKISRKAIKRKKQTFVIDENIEKFFPPISRMGIPSHTQWEKIQLTSPQKTAKVPL